MGSPLTYISLFSSAGLGCYGFKQAGFDCVATAELLERRVAVQRANDVCSEADGYICGDLTERSVRDRVLDRARKFTEKMSTDITAVIATPPCQGMSVANHKKRHDEIVRNSLVLTSLDIIKEIRPLYFVLENVRSFLKTLSSRDGVTQKTISDEIDATLSEFYRIESRVLNLKDFGSPSSRTRTLVIGTRKDIEDVDPAALFPDEKQSGSIQDLIGHLPPLTDFGEVDPDDFLHAFRPYKTHMRPWISTLAQGQSAFENANATLRPHRVIDGRVIENKAVNGDKYKRQVWEKTPPCVHTRNDILASQNTVHPRDDRVFSIRELMLFMGVPADFAWTEIEKSQDINAWPLEEKQKYLKKNAPNIRQCLGEGVPTPVFRGLAEKMRTSVAANT